MSSYKDDMDTSKDNRSNREKNDRKISSQLNSSLEDMGISVSEDLINRTLEAVKKQEAAPIKTEKDGQEESISFGNRTKKKAISWYKYARIIAGAAAAVFVVVVGWNAIGGLENVNRDLSTGMSAQESTNADNAAAEVVTPAQDSGSALYDTDKSMENSGTGNAPSNQTEAERNGTAKEDSADSSENQNNCEENSSAKKNTGKQSASAQQDTSEALPDKDNKASDQTGDMDSARLGIKAGIGDTKTEEPSVGESKLAKAAPEEDLVGGLGIAPSVTKIPDQVYGISELSFRSIFLGSPEKAEYIKITDKTTQTSVTLTSQEKIKSFYDIMDQFHFTSKAQISYVYKYTIEAVDLKSQQNSYTMAIGDSICVSYIFGEVAANSCYDTGDMQKLISYLEELLQENGGKGN